MVLEKLSRAYRDANSDMTLDFRTNNKGNAALKETDLTEVLYNNPSSSLLLTRLRKWGLSRERGQKDQKLRYLR